jgi:hypothetical protein
MGIAEIIEDYTESLGSFHNFIRLLKLNDFKEGIKGIRFEESFVLGATIILRIWTQNNQPHATVNNLCNLLNTRIPKTCSRKFS